MRYIYLGLAILLIIILLAWMGSDWSDRKNAEQFDILNDLQKAPVYDQGPYGSPPILMAGTDSAGYVAGKDSPLMPSLQFTDIANWEKTPRVHNVLAKPSPLSGSVDATGLTYGADGNRAGSVTKCAEYPPCEYYYGSHGGFATDGIMDRWDKCVYTDPNCPYMKSHFDLKNQATPLPSTDAGCKTVIYAKDIPLVENSAAPLRQTYSTP